MNALLLPADSPVWAESVSGHHLFWRSSAAATVLCD